MKKQKQKRYKQEHIELAKKFLANKHVQFELETDTTECTDGDVITEHTARFAIAVRDRIWTDGTSTWSAGVKKGVRVSELSLCATRSSADDVGYWSGGLAGNVYYDGSGKRGTWWDGEEYTLEEKGGLINGVKKEGESDGFIYGDDGFDANLRKYLETKCDFAEQLWQYLDFGYSEQGAQSEGCVNLDVEMEGDFWLEAQAQLEGTKLRAKAAA